MRRCLIAGFALGALLVPMSPGAARAAEETRRIGDSSDVVSAAVEISRDEWSVGSASIVVLGRDDVFADSLAGAALAGTDGPVLFTPGGPSAALRSDVRAEIQRVLPAPSPCGGSSEIVIAGGTGAVSTAVQSELEGLGYCVTRVAGASRVTTAVAIANKVAARGGDVSTVLLSRSDNWPDSATGGAFAAAGRHPILVTPPGGLDPAVASFLSERRPSEIVMLGGAAALNEDVELAASAYGAVRRVFGADRAATAVGIASELWARREPGGVMLVNGFESTGWAYAIAGSVTAARSGAAQLLVQADQVSSGVTTYLRSTDDTFTLVVGPTSSVSDAVVANVDATRSSDDGPPSGRYREEVFPAFSKMVGVSYGTATDINGSSVRLTFDLYEPAGDTVDGRPLIVYVHGGGFWRGGTGEWEDPAFLPMTLRGYVVAAIDYRVVPHPGCDAGASAACITGMQHALEDAQNAVRFLRSNASTYGIDPDRIAMQGGSAGAITSLNVAARSSETPDAAIQAAVSCAGARYLGGAFNAGDPPLQFFHGTADDVVPHSEATRSMNEARDNGITAQMTTFDGLGHGWIERVDTVVADVTDFYWEQLDLQSAPS